MDVSKLVTSAFFGTFISVVRFLGEAGSGARAKRAHAREARERARSARTSAKRADAR